MNTFTSNHRAVSDSFNYGASGLSVFEQNQDQTVEQDHTIMQAILPNKNWDVSHIKPADMKLDSSKPAGKLPEMQNRAQNVHIDLKSTMQDFKNTFEAAQGQAWGALKEAAGDQYSNAELQNTFGIVDDVPTKAGAMAQMAVGSIADVAFVGAGSLVTTMSNAQTMHAEISEQQKKLPKAEQEALIKETLKILNTPANPDQAVTQTPGESVPQVEKSPFSWEDVTPEQFQDFLKADVEDQPEFKEMLQMDEALESVHENHIENEERKYDPTPERIIYAAEHEPGELHKFGLDEKQIDAALERPELAYKVATYEIDPNDVIAPKPSAGMLAMQSDSLRDISGIKMNRDISFGQEVEMKLLMDRLKTAPIAPQQQPLPAISSSFGA